ncbi:hypothetical protein NDU88_003726 [Pleurodeles waltl]|uniref:Uncharacterized protein n=1 Tax=Pleurodeles waltl TaxID=8319 RepID=A0AAV7NLH8_PLEWA|nr:hypothetical protein NDU88_003726 [Pleurodeles waltl]
MLLEELRSGFCQKISSIHYFPLRDIPNWKGGVPPLCEAPGWWSGRRSRRSSAVTGETQRFPAVREAVRAKRFGEEGRPRLGPWFAGLPVEAPQKRMCLGLPGGPLLMQRVRAASHGSRTLPSVKLDLRCWAEEEKREKYALEVREARARPVD